MDLPTRQPHLPPKLLGVHHNGQNIAYLISIEVEGDQVGEVGQGSDGGYLILLDIQLGKFDETRQHRDITYLVASDAQNSESERDFLDNQACS